ncbi:Nitrilotriacetate monooxygenase component A [Pigmentiphaga humi]|uniref:Nitrilotriacetate monooxygenase component A n=1 Tax=Pigmentiphaga humi TaxID=2478468 RepID=A0A3P4AYU7_9BURK|nr:LLM class flavin-dependent oxidoreductase [Pigmentiphaga humi]VCU68630.1 Nitrilotriacetate monooxygenase component A [Pigmentiphaga humi]
MAVKNSSMILSASVMHGLGMHLGAWAARDGEVTDYLRPEMYLQIARTAEAGKLHAIFLADGMTNAEAGTERPCGSMDPVTILALMAAVTNRIGLVGTASTTYNQPYDLARRFATLDHLTRGRAGWNSVATFLPAVASMFGGGTLPDHESRYARADEFIDVTLKLWDSWEDDALVGDKANKLFAHAGKVHEINHAGEYFSVRGPLPFARPPQGRPVIFQAGASPEGRDQAAKYADVVFTAQHLLEGGVEFRSDMRRRAQSYGRHPDQIKILPGILPVLGATEADAWRRKDMMDEALGLGPELLKLARRVGLDVEVLKLDEPFPAHLLGPDEAFSGSIGFRRTLVNLAVKEKLTVRQLLARYGGGHQQIVGTPEQVADIMATWLEAGGADGFNLMVDMLPSGFDDVVGMLVPELQRRGMFHREYEHATLRENLGLGEGPFPTR